MVNPYWQETLFLVTEQITILACPMVYSFWDEPSSISEHYHISRYAESHWRYVDCYGFSPTSVMVLVPCGESFRGGLLIMSRLGKLAAWRIYWKQSAAAADLMMQQHHQIERAWPCRADCSQPDSFLDTMRLFMLYMAVVQVKGSLVSNPIGCRACPG